MTALEIAVHDPRGVEVIERVRPDRIELCAALSTGGVTPSVGLIETAVATGIPVHVLVRPREGGFDYDAAEKRVIVADVVRAMRSGAAGVVVGGLASGSVDLDLVQRAQGAVGSGEVTFHRAFDQTADLFASLDALVRVGVTRVLTSGARPTAAGALDVLSALVARATGRIQIMAGAGITSRNAAAIAATGVDALHASAKRIMTARLAVSLGSAATAGEASYATTDENEAATLRDLLTRRAAS